MRTQERLIAKDVKHGHYQAIQFLLRRYHTVIASAWNVHIVLKGHGISPNS